MATLEKFRWVRRNRPGASWHRLLAELHDERDGISTWCGRILRFGLPSGEMLTVAKSRRGRIYPVCCQCEPTR